MYWLYGESILVDRQDSLNEVSKYWRIEKKNFFIIISPHVISQLMIGITIKTITN